MDTLSKGKATSDIYDNTVSVLNVIFFKIQMDYANGRIKTDEEFEKAFVKYYNLLDTGNNSDFMELPPDWAAGIGNNCTGREDVAGAMTSTAFAGAGNGGLGAYGASGYSGSSGESIIGFMASGEERVCELLTTLDTDDRVERFNALSKNSGKVNGIAGKVLGSFSKDHKYVRVGEYVAPVRDDNYMTDERKAIYNKIENTFGKFNCCARKSSLTVGDFKPSRWRTSGSGQNRVAYIASNTAISVKGYESNMRSSFIDFMCTLGTNEDKLGEFEGIENELISYFEGEDLAELLRVNYAGMENLNFNEYRKFDKLLKPIADHYGYKLKDRYGKKGKELRTEFLTDLWNLYSLIVGKMSRFKTVDDYMTCISGVSPFDATDATMAKCYFNLCREYKNDTIERVEYYDSVSVGI